MEQQLVFIYSMVSRDYRLQVKVAHLKSLVAIVPAQQRRRHYKEAVKSRSSHRQRKCVLFVSVSQCAVFSFLVAIHVFARFVQPIKDLQSSSESVPSAEVLSEKPQLFTEE
jgi:AmiR/NasT family two-component response regulator